MKKPSRVVRDLLIMVAALCAAFSVGLCIQNWMHSQELIPAVFVLAVFLISLSTTGYGYGLVSAGLSVLMVNYAFTFPYFKVNFSILENLVSGVIMIIVTVATSMLTTKIKQHEAMKAESEKEKMRANLLRAISHDLRTPLTTIYGSSSAILENDEMLSKEQKTRMLQGIKEDSQWLIRMVENLLSVTKIDGGNVKIVKVPVVLDELIDSVLRKFKSRYPEQTVFLDLPEEFIMIPMDALLMEQVIVNILENAVQHAVGMTKLSLHVFVLAKKVIFEIKDDGCGIPEERLWDIFAGLYSSSNTSSDSQKRNAGIGLSVCSTIIRAHGGEITAENAKSGGAVFRFVLDMEDGDE